MCIWPNAMKQKQKLISLPELLGWFFTLSTRLAPPFFKIARLIVCWHYRGASVYNEIDITFIFLQKIFNSLSSICSWKSNNSFDHWEENVYFWDLFLSNWFLFSTFSWRNTVKIPLGAHSTSSPPFPNPQLIIVIAARLFSQNSKKKQPANFSLFRPLLKWLKSSLILVITQISLWSWQF